MKFPGLKFEKPSDYFLLVPFAFIAMYITIAVLRIGYTFELEWLEGVTLQHVQRILAGLPIYVKPSLKFAPLIYTPLYYYLAAIFTKVFGLSFFSLRLLSLLASLGCLTFIYLIVWRETKSFRAAIIAAGLYAATFRACGAWFDIARVDSLFLFFILAGVFTLQKAESWKSFAWAGVWLFLAFMTKQTALLIIASILLYAWFWKRRGFWPLAITLGISLGISTLIINSNSDGWYIYYIFGLVSHYPISAARIATFWTTDLLGVTPILLGVAVCYFAVLWFNRKLSESNWFIMLVALGALATSWLARINIGGYDNVLIPIYALLSIVTGFAVSSWEKISPLKIGKSWPIRADLVIALLLQFLLLFYNPTAQLPKSSDLKTGQQLVQTLRSFPGQIFLFYNGYLAERAGKEQYADISPLSDTILYGAPGLIRDQLISEVRDAIRERKFSALIGNGSGADPLFNFFRADMEAAYPQKGNLLYMENDFYPVTGCQVRPNYIYYLPKKTIEPGQGTLDVKQ
jgi:hypothetical protein